MKIRPVEAELLQADEMSDWLNEAFRNFAISPKIIVFFYICLFSNLYYVL
jgi:hypothetical protein